jgi:hypothetical protein
MLGTAYGRLALEIIALVGGKRCLGGFFRLFKAAYNP